MHSNPPEYKILEMSRNLCIVRMSLKTMSRNNLQKSPKRHSKRPGDLMKNLETPGKPGELAGMLVSHVVTHLVINFHLVDNICTFLKLCV